MDEFSVESLETQIQQAQGAAAAGMPAGRLKELVGIALSGGKHHGVSRLYELADDARVLIDGEALRCLLELALIAKTSDDEPVDFPTERPPIARNPTPEDITPELLNILINGTSKMEDVTMHSDQLLPILELALQAKVDEKKKNKRWKH